MPGQQPNPQNEIENRPVYCMSCSRVYLSRARRPVCSKCRSKKVVAYATMGDKAEIHSLRTVVGDICEALKSLENNQESITRHQNELYNSQKLLYDRCQSNKQVQMKIIEILRNRNLISSSDSITKTTISKPDLLSRLEKKEKKKSSKKMLLDLRPLKAK